MIIPKLTTLAPAMNVCPEDQMLCCAQICLDAATAKQISSLLREDLDWR